MKNVISKIIQEHIPKGCIFDAHSIIEYLIQNQSDIYLSSYKNEWTTEYYHSVISKEIAQYEDTLLERVGQSWSLNIHKNFSTNVCWIKL